MNAVRVSRHASPEVDAMPANEDSRDGANRSEQLAELRSDVRHLQADVTELKTEVRATNQRIDVLGEKLDKKIDGLRDKGNEKMTDLLLRVEGVSKSVGSAKPLSRRYKRSSPRISCSTSSS